MRFNTTKFFKINELLLDQENYRFGLAHNQKECIDLIYRDSPTNFENLLNDIISNNIGDYPLVFSNEKNENIVLDGNRRVSILKVINDPSLAPSKRIEDLIKKIDKKSLPFNLNKIGCFVSADKQDILKTVYERHAAGKGISRIHWSAFATAKFRYDAHIEDADWRAIAILLHVISIDIDSNDYVQSPRFSFEVFKRLIRHAYLNNYIHFEVFNEEKAILNSESNFFSIAIELVKELIKAIDNNEIGLSRGKNYASEAFLSEFFEYRFHKLDIEKPPRTRRKKVVKPVTPPVAPQLPTSTNPIVPPSSQTGLLPPPQIGLPFIEPKAKLEIPDIPSLIEENNFLINALNQLAVHKFSLIYKSLTDLNSKKYVIIAVVAAWSFLDSLPRVAGWSDTDFTSYYNNHIKKFITSKEQQTSIRHSLSWLSNEGNCNKHSSDYVTLDHKEFVKHFNNIQYFISKVILEIILPNKKVARTDDF
jgi:hypothetical protein